MPVDRFDDRARWAVERARQAAQDLQHDQVGTEHLLLGLVADGGSDAGQALSACGITFEACRAKVVEAVANKRLGSPPSELTFTDRAKLALERAGRMALRQRSERTGTRHILLSVLDVEGTAGQVLRGMSVDPERVRREMDRAAADPAADPPAPAGGPGDGAARPRDGAGGPGSGAGSPGSAAARTGGAVPRDGGPAARAGGPDGGAAGSGSGAGAGPAAGTRPAAAGHPAAAGPDAGDGQPGPAARHPAAAGPSGAGAEPLCPGCRAPLGRALAQKPAAARGPAGTTTVVLVYCSSCGTTIGMLPGPATTPAGRRRS